MKTCQRPPKTFGIHLMSMYQVRLDLINNCFYSMQNNRQPDCINDKTQLPVMTLVVWQIECFNALNINLIFENRRVAGNEINIMSTINKVFVPPDEMYTSSVCDIYYLNFSSLLIKFKFAPFPNTWLFKACTSLCYPVFGDNYAY